MIHSIIPSDWGLPDQLQWGFYYFLFQCILLRIFFPRKIDAELAWSLTIALFVFDLAVRLMYIWIGLTFEFGFEIERFYLNPDFRNDQMVFHSIKWILGGSWAHFMLYTLARLISLWRSHQLNRPTLWFTLSMTALMVISGMISTNLYYQLQIRGLSIELLYIVPIFPK